MTPEQMRERLAEWRGWQKGHWQRFGASTPEANVGKIWCDYGVTAPDGETCDRLPDYPNDLNAVRKLEMRLTDDQCRSYQSHLIGCIRPKFGWALRGLISASAVQRCEALCKTLGLWEGDRKGV